MSMPLPDEIDLEQPVLEAVRQGDRYAFGEFARRQGQWVRGVVYAVLGNRDGIDDVCQRIWAQVWTEAPRLRDIARWRPWLDRMARNAAVDAGREMTRRRRVAERAPVPARETAGDAGEALVRSEQHLTVLDAIEALPVIYREPFVLRHVWNWSYQRISEVMGLPIDTVETRLVRARRLLREALKDKV